MVSLSRLCVALVVIFLPLLLNGTQAGGPPDRYVCTAPPGVGLHATNSQMILSPGGVLFCATRAQSSIGGLVWRQDGYVDEAHPGTPVIVLGGDPLKFYGNGELVVWPDGYLRYVTVEANSNRVPTKIVAYIVPGWNP